MLCCRDRLEPAGVVHRREDVQDEDPRPQHRPFQGKHYHLRTGFRIQGRGERLAGDARDGIRGRLDHEVLHRARHHEAGGGEQALTG